ncbi:MAG: cyanophycinase [Anaerolineae bacterium]
MPTLPVEGVARGPLMAIGGAEDKVGPRRVLRHFLRLAGDDAARIVVLPVASSFTAEVGERYLALFSDLGAARVDVIDVATREEALNPDLTRPLDNATGVFLSGGNQVKITTLLGGTPLATAVRHCHARGAVVGGTSAGASVLSQHMIAFGRGGGSPEQRMVSLAPGLGLTNRLVIDQHFRQRDRLGRLMSAVAVNPFLIGVGVDEDTAIVLNHHNMLEVLGTHSVTIVDGADITYTDIHHVKQYGSVSAHNLRVSILTNGQHYDVRARRAITPHPSAGFPEASLEMAEDE